MSDLTIGLLSALLATNQPQAVSNLVQQQTGIAVTVPDTSDPEGEGLRQLMISDDAAMDEVNQWISTNRLSQDDVEGNKLLNMKIRARLNEVGAQYQKFLREHPNSAKGYLAYGSFLNDTGDEDGAKVQYENSKQIDPSNPAAWNNLANYYGENGELTNAFTDYTEAIRLDPTEPVYYENFATTVFLYRKDVREFYKIDEAGVFDKALGLYRQAMKLDPNNLVLATDFAESYYGIRPLRTNDALVAWTNALNISKDDNEREGVEVHLARVKIIAGMYDQAQGHLNTITNPVYGDTKHTLERSLKEHKDGTFGQDLPAVTNQPVVVQKPVEVKPVTAIVVDATNNAVTFTNPAALEVAPPTMLQAPK